MRFARNFKSLAAAGITATIVCAIILSVTFNSNSGKEPEKVPVYEYIVLTKDIKQGDVIKEEDITVKEFPMQIAEAHQGRADVIGRTANQDLEHDKPIMPPFLKPIIVTEKEDQDLRPGYSAVPILINKGQLPPYVAKGQKYDLYTRNGNFKIENLKVLDVMDQPNNNDNKLLVIEINTPNVSSLIEEMHNHGGFVFVRRNEEELGNYKYIVKKDKPSGDITRDILAGEKLPVLPKTDETLNALIEKEIQKVEQEAKNTKEVEIIIGNQKTKMEFKQ